MVCYQKSDDKDFAVVEFIENTAKLVISTGSITEFFQNHTFSNTSFYNYFCKNLLCTDLIDKMSDVCNNTLY